MIVITCDPHRALKALRKTKRGLDRLSKRRRHWTSCPTSLAIDGHAYHRRTRNRRGSR